MSTALAIPAQPVDGYTVMLWRVRRVPLGIDELRYVYHVRTPWSEFSDATTPGGALIEDDWMVYEGGQCTGRLCGWGSLHVGHRDDGAWYTTREAAEAKLRDLVAHELADARRSVQELEALLATLPQPVEPSTR